MADASGEKSIKKYSETELNEMMSAKLRYLAKLYGAGPDLIRKEDLVAFLMAKQNGSAPPSVNTEAKPKVTPITPIKPPAAAPVITRKETPEEEEAREAAEEAEEADESPEVETPPLPTATTKTGRMSASAPNLSNAPKAAPIPEPEPEPEHIEEPPAPKQVLISKKTGSKSEVVIEMLERINSKLDAIGAELDVINAVLTKHGMK